MHPDDEFTPVPGTYGIKLPASRESLALAHAGAAFASLAEHFGEASRRVDQMQGQERAAYLDGFKHDVAEARDLLADFDRAIEGLAAEDRNGGPR